METEILPFDAASEDMMESLSERISDEEKRIKKLTEDLRLFCHELISFSEDESEIFYHRVDDFRKVIPFLIRLHENSDLPLRDRYNYHDTRYLLSNIFYEAGVQRNKKNEKGADFDYMFLDRLMRLSSVFLNLDSDDISMITGEKNDCIDQDIRQLLQYAMALHTNYDVSVPEFDWIRQKRYVRSTYICLRRSVSYDTAFDRMDVDVPCIIALSKWARERICDSFLNNPSRFIEKDTSMVVRPVSPAISPLFARPYDYARVRVRNDVVYKRIDLLKVNHALEEVSVANAVSEKLKNKDMQDINVQQFEGFLADKGNMYLLSRFIPDAHRLDDDNDKAILDSLDTSLQGLHVDMNGRNVLRSRQDPQKLTIIDFETKPRS